VWGTAPGSARRQAKEVECSRARWWVVNANEAGVLLGLAATIEVVHAVYGLFGRWAAGGRSRPSVGTLPGRLVWRAAAACGAALLLVYGLFNIVVGWAVLTGVITSPGGYNHAGEHGPAVCGIFFLPRGCIPGRRLDADKDDQGG
jgi:hypothetical protein